MAIASEAAYYEALTRPWQRLRVSKNSLTTVAGRAFSSWLQGGTPAAGAAPTTAAVPTRATAGSLTASSGGQNFFDSAGTQRILRAVIDHAPTAAAGGMVTICDRRSHQGGLSGTTAGAQTTNLPTAALTRGDTTGVGVELGLEIYTQIGTTGTTVTASYTDNDGNAAQVTKAATFGNTGFREASRLVILPLSEGDRGVREVASVSLVASTLTAGNFGVTLFYPLVHIPLDDILSLRGYADALYGFGAWFPVVEANACLMFVYHTAGALTGVMQADFSVCED